ncbi:MAG: methyltransferase domain-containing protein [Bacteroidota bacterium]
MDKAYYDQYAIAERSHWWFLGREKILSQMVDKYSAKDSKQELSILNIGAATGRTSEWLSAFGSVTTSEFDPDCCEYLKQQGVAVEQASMTELPYADDSFDVVCAFDVIEHIDDHEMAMKELKRVLKPEGRGYVSVPALMQLWSDHDVINHHYRRYTRSELEEVITKTGLNRVRLSYFNFVMFPLIYIVRRYVSKPSQNHNEAKSDFSSYKVGGATNAILKWLFSTERRWLRFANFPIGVSLLAVLSKK